MTPANRHYDAQLRCERCKRFIGEDCLEGWDGGIFGDYNGSYYCAPEKGCNRTPAEIRQAEIEKFGPGLINAR